MSGETVITIVGNLTADPELRWTQSGSPVASFTIASTPRSFDRQSGEWKDGETLFMRCTAWREMAENIAESLRKGMRTVVRGRLSCSGLSRPVRAIVALSLSFKPMRLASRCVMRGRRSRALEATASRASPQRPLASLPLPGSRNRLAARIRGQKQCCPLILRSEREGAPENDRDTLSSDP